MKKVLFIFLGITLLSLSSCFKLDNWDEPDCTFHGTVYDVYTGDILLASQNDWQIRIWERTWKGHEGGAVSHQELRIKQDGTYQNTKLFAGTYDMLPYNGSFWPVDTAKGVVLKKSTKQDFIVAPYVHVVEFSQVAFWDESRSRYNLRLRFKVQVPSDEKGVVLEKNGRLLPLLNEVRPFISLSHWCGAGDNSFLNFPEYTSDLTLRNPDKTWEQIFTEPFKIGQTDIPAGNGKDTSGTFQITAPVKANYTYYVRIGARVKDAYEKWNYSEIKKLDIPGPGEAIVNF